MSKFKTTAAALTVSLLIGAVSTAQNVKIQPIKAILPIYHEVSFGGTVSTSGILQRFDALQTPDAQRSKIKPSFNAGGGLQVNYILHFNENISLVFGTAAKYGKSTYNFDRLYEESTRRWLRTSIEDTFSFRANISNYTETHHALHLQIPLLFGYETGTSLSSVRWYVNTGIAAQFTVYRKYSAKISRFTTTGYSFLKNGNLENIPDLGFGTESDLDVSGKPTLKFTVNHYLETGTKIFIGKGVWMYIGLFGEISTLRNSISETGSSKENLVNYALSESPSNKLMDNLNITSITNTKYTSGGHTYAFGGIIRFSLDFRSSIRMFSEPLRGFID